MTSQTEQEQSNRKRALELALIILGAAVIVYLLLWYGPEVIARHDVGNVTGPLRTFRLQQAMDAARGRLLTLGAGLFAAGALLFTARNYGVARETLKLTEQGQVTERYTKAIEQLGSDKLDVRIGGIYALERIARDSARDHPTVMEVLAAFIREHSSEQWPTTARDSAVVDEYSAALIPRPRPDVQAAVTVIGRRDSRYDREPINLRHADLAGADLDGANLVGAWLNFVDFTNASLSGANLTGANLTVACLTDAFALGTNFTHALLQDAKLGGFFIGAIFVDASLQRADLSGAALRDTNFDHAYLAAANLSRSVLRNASLRGVNLEAADLTDADLTTADLSGAVLSPEATVPPGWARDPQSGELMPGD